MLSVSSGPSAKYIQMLTLLVGMLAFLVLLAALASGKSKVDRSFGYLTFFLVLGLLSMVSSGESLQSYASLVALLVTSYVVAETSSAEQFTATFTNALSVIVAVSMAGAAYIAAYGAPVPFSIETTPLANTTFYNYVIFFYPSLWPGVMLRNQGLFWEPGLFAGFLVLGLVLEISFRKRPSIARSAVLILGLLSTSSTSGILMLPLIAVLFVDRFVDRPGMRAAWVMSLFGVFFVGWLHGETLLTWLQATNPSVFGKLLSAEITMTTRANAPLLNLRIFGEHPFLGAGFGGANSEFTALKTLYSADSQTSTSTYMLAAWGVGGVLYTLWWLRSILSVRRRSIVASVTIAVIVLFVLNSQPHGALMATWALFFALPKWAEGIESGRPFDMVALSEIAEKQVSATGRAPSVDVTAVASS